ncbi:hypothetical protein [Salinarimonas sp.]|uniref:hypothetical protein n=1 Tax=Salinarimonas sp. TaxID=2766526 RepID=UPI0032D8D829
MRLLALSIAASVGTAPLPGAFGVAHATAAHAEHGAGLRLVGATCEAVQADHEGHREMEITSRLAVGDRVLFEADRVNGAITITRIEKAD